jgi:hypothetical protein
MKGYKLRYITYLKALLIFFLTPITVGAAIYLLFRPTNLTVFHWADKVGLYGYVMIVRTHLDIAQYLPSWAIYSLPNGLWAFSFMVLISIIWGNAKSTEKTTFITLVIILSVGSEIGQLNSLIPGTFCLVDVTFNTIGVLSGYYIGQLYIRREINNENNQNNIISDMCSGVSCISSR